MFGSKWVQGKTNNKQHTHVYSGQEKGTRSRQRLGTSRKGLHEDLFWIWTGVSGSHACLSPAHPPGDTPLVTCLLSSRQLGTLTRLGPFLPNSQSCFCFIPKRGISFLPLSPNQKRNNSLCSDRHKENTGEVSVRVGVLNLTGEERVPTNSYR